MIDFHTHLLPAVDDGAATLDETRAALAAMWEQGIRTVVATPHLAGSTTARPDAFHVTMSHFDTAFLAVSELARSEFPDLRLDRGVELMLDSPSIDLADARVRLGGTKAVLVEFPSMVAPPHGVNALYELDRAGWRIVVAHPERYRNLYDLATVREWKKVGCLLQVNIGSLVGRYGSGAQRLAWRILEAGLGDFLCSDYHARGRLRVAEVMEVLRVRGGAEQLELLTRENPARLLAGVETVPVPPLAPRLTWWKRALGRRS